MSMSKNTGLKPEDVEPINPGLGAKAERFVYWTVGALALSSVAAMILVRAGVAQGNNLGYWASLGLSLIVLFLIVPRVSETLIARRRYGYTREEYRLAKKRGEGEVLTEEEHRQRMRDAEEERAEIIEERVNRMLDELDQMAEIGVDHWFENDRLRVEAGDSK